MTLYTGMRFQYDVGMKIGIYGLGRFGYFWASVLAESFDVYAYNRNPQRAVPPEVTRCSLEELCSLDVLILCVSISSFETVLKSIAPMISSGTLVMDTCSVKVHPARIMEQVLPEQVPFIATHPMFGPDSGRDGVSGLPFVFSPIRCSSETSEYWEHQFSEVMQMQVIRMTPEEHDREAAFTQGITHVIGRVLGELELQPSEIGTAGYNSLLTIIEQTCNDPMQLFFDLQRYNPYTREMHQKLSGSLDSVMKQLAEADNQQEMI